MPVVQPEKPWSPYPISHRDLKPSNLIQRARCLNSYCRWEGDAADLMPARDGIRKACPSCDDIEIKITTTAGRAA